MKTSFDAVVKSKLVLPDYQQNIPAVKRFVRQAGRTAHYHIVPGVFFRVVDREPVTGDEPGGAPS